MSEGWVYVLTNEHMMGVVLEWVYETGGVCKRE